MNMETDRPISLHQCGQTFETSEPGTATKVWMEELLTDRYEEIYSGTACLLELDQERIKKVKTSSHVRWPIQDVHTKTGRERN